MNSRPPRRHQRGIILIVGMLFLVILTLLGLSMFRSTGLMERISANTRDKQRSFESAQAALQYGEWWLGQNNAGNAMNPTTCSTLDALTSDLHVCLNALSATVSTDPLPFAAGFQYTPANATVLAGGGLTTAGGDVNLQARPGLYIENKGMSTDGKSVIYQVTSYGYGGNADTGTVLRSTYKVTSADHCLDCLQ